MNEVAAFPSAADAAGTVYAFPLSSGQQRLWFLSRIAPQSVAYNLHTEVAIAAAVDVAALRLALDTVVQRHEVLRTTFCEVGGEPQQRVHGQWSIALATADLSGRPAAERDAQLGQIARQHASAVFNLEEGPLLRCKLVKLAPQAHMLLIALHHIVADAWSIQLLWRELSVAYLSLHTGRPPALPELEIQYADYAVWQRERLQGEALARLRTHWLSTLSGFTELALPLDHPRPHLTTHEGGQRRLQLPSPTAQALRALARDEGATPFMVLCAAFAAVLGQWARQDDVLIGTPVNTRQRAELEPLIGFFVNMLPLRFDVSAQPSLRGMTQRARLTLAQAYSHQDLPFEQLTEMLQLPRDLSRNPLFQVTVQYLAAAPGAAGGGDTAALQDVGAGGAIFDLALSLWDAGAGLQGSIEYDRQLFEASTVERIAADFVALLERSLRSPDSPMSRLPLLTDDEAQRLLQGGAGPVVAGDKRPGLVEMLAATAARRGDAPAVRWDGPDWSYAELARASLRLAHGLREAGVGPDDRVALQLGADSPWYVTAIWACWRLGAGYVPIDLAWPPARQAAVLADARPRLLLSQRIGPQGGAAPATVPMHAPDVLAAGAAAAGGLGAPPDDTLAYLLYTSGSTGEPKGVAMGHRALANQLHWMLHQFGLGDDDTVLQKTPTSFDASVWELLLPLLSGASLALPAAGSHRDPALLTAAVQRFGVTTLQLVPSMLRPFLEHPAAARSRTLRRLFVGGEALPLSCSRLAAEMLGLPVVNLYGPTETCVQASFHLLTEGEPGRNAPIGRPVHNTWLYVLDDAMRLLPPGRVGELFIAGAGLARGYWQRGAETALRFVPDPFAACPGQRMYRSGDLARWRDDGVLEFHGRSGGQNKLRGNRIELGEVEAVLLAQAEVRQAAAVLSSGPGGEPRLVAHVAWLPGYAGTPQQLRRRLAQELPEVMVPSLIQAHEHLPLLASGKIDRIALAALAPLPASSTGQAAPRDALERALCDLWCEVLEQQGLGVDDDFFADLGGHSLLAVRLNARLVDFFQLELPLQRIFECPTVSSYASSLREDPQLGERVARIEQLLASLEAAPAGGQGVDR